MKKLLLALLLLPVLSAAQEKKVKLTHKLMYEFKSDYEAAKIDVYYSPDRNIVEMGDKKFLLKDQLILPVDINLDGTVNLPDGYEYKRLDSIPSFILTPINKKDKVNGIPCNYYDVQIENDNEKMKMCISENNPINILGALPVTNKNIKGLIVKIDFENRRKESFELKSVEKVKSFISMDWNKTIAGLKKQNTVNIDSLSAAYITDSTAVDSAAVPYDYDDYSIAADSIAVPYVHDDEIYVTPYNSDYKNIKIEDTNLAIDNLEKDSSYWQGIPQYCSNLDSRIPEFSDKKLKEHAKNYAGQICDLYLSEIKKYSVDVKLTLDQIRHEENYFNNNQFGEKDKKLFTNFLNGLD